MKTISAAQARLQFCSLLREVAAGKVVTILARGKPVATMAPAQAQDMPRQAARSSLLQRLHGQQPLGSRDWTRGELYGD
ncbi:type II toxin-antitoxin system Phd/YefM family antitoxin [Azohydromonas aeria]|uniref:type II toxin-antitoxin system Phd/YefM family antitoxin n=1 Tax=Azohydromonas aeria TaxID=2590212 RepID=UPI0012FB219C|nr:type II toxin-antitoxin system prevent-host-death family antitoxin [Azohydromonas aeria]